MKVYVEIGYGSQVETVPGIWTEGIMTRQYYGDLYKNTSASQSSGSQNDDIKLSNKLSIVAEPYARDNMMLMKYVKWKGVKWKVQDVEEKYPRLVISFGGGIYHD